MGIPLNIDWQQIFLHLFNFSILAGGLFFLLYKPVKKFMAKREEYYKKLGDEAEEKLAKAKALEADMQKKLEESDALIQKKRSEAEAELTKYTDEKMSEAQAMADKLVSDAYKNAEKQRQDIIKSAESEIVDIVKTAAAKLAYKDTSEAYDGFLDIAERSTQEDAQQREK
ncbi:MAG: ATP synthase F0 subunit B [Eubacteriales bacterium]